MRGMPASNRLAVYDAGDEARAIADEWDAQREKVRPQTMPMMQFAATAIDRVGAGRDRVVAELAGRGSRLCETAEVLHSHLSIRRAESTRLVGP